MKQYFKRLFRALAGIESVNSVEGIRIILTNNDSLTSVEFPETWANSKDLHIDLSNTKIKKFKL